MNGLSRSARQGWVPLLGLLAVTTPLSGQRPSPADSTGDSSRVVLAPIEVSVSRSSRPLSDVPFAVSRLDVDDLRRGRPTLGLDEALVEIPGVGVSNRYNPSLDQQISIRGFGARSAFGVRGIKVLIDGIPQTLPDGQGQLTNLDLASVGSIEVLRGAASSLYGNASGGVIDIRTAPADPTQTTLSARVVGGDFGSLKAVAGATSPLALGTLAVDATLTRADGFREHSESEIRQASIRVRQDPSSRTSLIFAGFLADAPVLDNPGSLNQAELTADPTQANPGNVAADAGKTVRQGQAGLTIEHRFTPRTRGHLTVHGLFRDLDNPLSFAFINVDRAAWGVRGSVNAELGNGAAAPTVTAGFDLQRMRDDRLNRTPDGLTLTLDQRETVMEIGPFAQIAIDAGSRATVTAGVRYDRLSFKAEDFFLSNGDDSGDRTMAALSGSFGIVFHAGEGIQPYVSVGTAFESPTTTELANRPSGPGGFNPDLDPQRAATVEAGIRLSRSGLAVDAAAYFTDVSDALIPFEVPTDPTRRFFRNAGSARHLGVEAAVTWSPDPRVTVKSAYNLTRHTFVDFQTDTETFDGNRLPGIPTQQWYGSVRMTPGSDVFVAIDHTIRSSLYADDANLTLVDAWGVTGIRVGMERAVGGYVVGPFFGVLNATDRSYVGSVVVNAGFGRYYEPAPGRNAYVGVSLAPVR